MMINDKNALYQAFKSKDPRFDGQFFVGISSTGIYCRPTCSARVAKEENCNFFKTAAEAEKSGYRPCLICRPELAPSIIGEQKTIASRAAIFLEENCGSDLSISEMAKELDCSDRHLRRVFMDEYEVSPVEYLQTCRLLLSKNLLTETNLSITDIAMASGFGSLRRFNELFKEKYRLSPTKFRKQLENGKSSESEITISLGYKSPYNWNQILNFLSMRAIPGVEIVRDGSYFRTIRQRGRDDIEYFGWIKVSNLPDKNSLSLTISESLIKVLPHIIAKVKRLFDLRSDPDLIYDALKEMNELKDNLCINGTRIPGCADEFELSVRAVLGQQITVKAASTLAGRIAKKYGMPIETDIEGLNVIFPSPEEILKLDGDIEDNLGSLGIINSRAKAIEKLAEFFAVQKNISGSIIYQEDIIEKLIKIPGIGPWTANYIAMRGFCFTDIFLETDYGIKKALAPMNSKEILAEAEKWKPWRSYAVINIWNYLQESEE